MTKACQCCCLATLKMTFHRSPDFKISRVETGQMSAAETEQMSAVATRQMQKIETGQSPVSRVDTFLSQQQASVLSQQQTSALSIPVSTAYICPVSTEHIFSGGPGTSSLQPIDQITILGIRPEHNPGRPAQTGSDRRSPGYGAKHPQTDPPYLHAKARTIAVRQTNSKHPSLGASSHEIWMISGPALHVRAHHRISAHRQICPVFPQTALAEGF